MMCSVATAFVSTWPFIVKEKPMRLVPPTMAGPSKTTPPAKHLSPMPPFFERMAPEPSGPQPVICTGEGMNESPWLAVKEVFTCAPSRT